MDDMFTMSIVVMISQMCGDVRRYQIVHFKYMQLIVCQLYLIKVVKKKSCV